MATQQNTGQARAAAAMLAALRGDVRPSTGRVNDPRLKAVQQAGAEVLGGLRRAFVDYNRSSSSEDGWQR